MDKIELRKQLKKLRCSLSPEYISHCSNRIADYILQSEEYKRAGSIMGYLAFGNEISVDYILSQALADNKKVYVPLVLSATEMKAARIESMQDFVCDRYGIRSVAEPAESIMPELLDLILVPAVAFDRQGNRMGMGVGYYDRFLAHVPRKITCGITCTALLQEKLPCDVNDVPVAALADENGIRRIIND